MTGFKTELDIQLKPGSDNIFIIGSPLIYVSNILGKIIVPEGFETDFASVPRIPIIYAMFGDRAHREAVLHDAMYRIDFPGNISFMMANRVFLEAMQKRDKAFYISFPMFWGVCLGGYFSYHKLKMNDKLS